jgi:hypothetical protein
MEDKANLSPQVPEEITADNNDTIKQFLGDQPEVKEEPKTEEIPTPEGKPTSEPPSVPEPAPEVPLEEITAEVKKQTKEELTADILKTLGMSKEEKKEVEESGFKFAWEQRGEEAPASWKEQAAETIRLWEFQKQEQDTKLKEEQRQSIASEQARQATINAEWDAQLDYLRQEGLLPKIDPKIATKLKEGKLLTLEERNDPGLKAQVGIFETMYEVAREREAQGLQPIADAVHIYNRYYIPKQKDLPGKKAPVSGGTIPVSGKEEEVPYDELHNKDFFDLIKSS